MSGVAGNRFVDFYRMIVGYKRTNYRIDATIMRFKRQFHVLGIIRIFLSGRGVMQAEKLPKGQITFFLFVFDKMFHQQR